MINLILMACAGAVTAFVCRFLPQELMREKNHGARGYIANLILVGSCAVLANGYGDLAGGALAGGIGAIVLRAVQDKGRWRRG